MSRIIKTGLVAFGYSGRLFHAPFLHAHPGFQLLKVVERSKTNSKKIYPYVEVVTDLQTLLYDKTIELVVITTPSYLHYDMVKEALIAGKDVVVEKPFTATYGEANELIHLARQKNKVLAVYHNRRWDGDFLTVKKVINSKFLGKLIEYEAHFDRYTPSLNVKAWKEEGKKGTGNLFDLGSHLIDQVLCLFGMPLSVTAKILIQREVSKIDDYFRLKLDYEDLKVILKAGMLVKEPGPRYVLNGINGSFNKYGLDPQEEALKNGKSPTSADWGAEPEENWGVIETSIKKLEYKDKIKTIPGNYMGFYNNIYETISDKAELEIKPEVAGNNIRIIEAAFESSLKKCTIKLKI